MLPLKQVEEVRRLVDAGELSQRKIAAKLAVSRGTVSAIASGKRGLYGCESDPLDNLNSSGTPPERCLGCGALVFMPCVLCKTRAYIAQQQVIEPSSGPHHRAA
jgi:hypothetical protein